MTTQWLFKWAKQWFFFLSVLSQFAQLNYSLLLPSILGCDFFVWIPIRLSLFLFLSLSTAVHWFLLNFCCDIFSFHFLFIPPFPSYGKSWLCLSIAVSVCRLQLQHILFLFSLSHCHCCCHSLWCSTSSDCKQPNRLNFFFLNDFFLLNCLIDCPSNDY